MNFTSLLSRLSRRRWRSLPLRLRFALLLSWLTIVGGGTFGGIAVYTTYRNTFALTRQEFSGRARALAAHIEEILQTASRNVLLVSQLDSLQDLIHARKMNESGSGSSEAYEKLKEIGIEFFSAVLRSNEEYQRIRYIDNDGWEVLRVDKVGEEVIPISEAFLENTSAEEFFISTSRLDPGRIYTSPMGTLTTNRKDPKGRTFTMTFATPLIDVNGNMAGIVAVNVDPSNLVKQTIEPVLMEIEAEEGEILVTDNFRHFLFAQKQRDLVWFNPILPDKHYSPIFTEGFTAKPTILDMLGKGMPSAYLRLGDKFLFFSSAHSTPPGMKGEQGDWVIIIQIAVSAVTRPSIIISVKLAGVFLFVMVLGIFLAYFVSSKATRAIVDITDAAKRASQGDLSARANVFQDDEIGFLAEQFNRAMDIRFETEKELRRHRDRLDALVKERTLLLAESEDRYRTLFNEAPSGIALVSDGIIQMANKELARMLGVSSQDRLQGLPAMRIIHPEDAKVASEFIMNLTTDSKREEKNIPLNLECRLKRQDGNNLYAIVGGVGITYEGKPSALIIARDVSEMKLLTEQVARIQRIESLGTLAGGMAHDFNNLLTAITGFAELLNERLRKLEIQFDEVQKILTTVERGKALTSRILTFTGSRAIRKRRVSMNEFLTGFTQLLQRLIPENIEIKTSLPEEEVVITMDDGLMEQTLINLAVNARDALPNGGVIAIELDLVNLDESYFMMHRWIKQAEISSVTGRYCVISVSDNGQGMDTETQKHIFEPFFTTKEPGAGTGLGLAMVAGIVKQHNGFVNCYSEVNKGTTFRIYLPMDVKAEDEAEQVIGAAELNGEGLLLVAEDEEVLRELVRRVLEMYGYRVIVCEDGKSALEEFLRTKEEIKAVILDMVMPRMGGLETARKILSVSPSARILLMSGYAKQMIDEEMPSGTVLIQKPFSPRELAEKVKLILR